MIGRRSDDAPLLHAVGTDEYRRVRIRWVLALREVIIDMYAEQNIHTRTAS